MKQFMSLFIRYSIIFFLVIFSLISFGQYNIQGKIDLQFSLPLSSLLALLGGIIASIFIGGYKEQEAAPPLIQPFEYLEIDENILNAQLLKIRRKRTIFFSSFGLWPVYGISIVELGLPEYLIPVYMVAFFVLGVSLSYVKCPRCGYPFFSREISWKIYSGRLDNILSNKCMNCGLILRKTKDI